MWQKFTELAQKSILIAQEDAISRGASFVDVLHLLIGAIRVDYDDKWQNGTGLVSWLLTSNGIDAKSLYEHIVTHLDKANAVMDEPRLSKDAKRVLEGAANSARQMRNNSIGPEHLFIAILRTPHGEKVLGDFGLDADDLHRQLSSYLQNPQQHSEKSPDEELQKVLSQSQREATLSGCGRISCAHLLLCVLNDAEVKTLLQRCEVKVESLHDSLRARLVSDTEVAGTKPHYSKGAKRVLDLARQEAAQDEGFGIRPVHLLFALAQPERGLQTRWRNIMKPPHANDSTDFVLRDVRVETLRKALKNAQTPDENAVT